ncbi:hypothetical protein [Limosilactobacillus coleohominis]|uniref:hypothetical protein n=1 Tax=Limosilactobacillus coleohominis TaxID=181675 RepID=UPI0026EFABC4|nr:hypothetical protein [Limosilactobacillus coleohominis]
MSRTPKQILYILDYERYLKSRTKLPLANVMKGDECDWIETHKWCQQIVQNYKSAGVSWQKVEDTTGISKEIWQEKGVKS